ncbi:MAG TPA: RNA chaperone Hfq [Candidatus Baltobacteraceae bacterium]|jgi:host factor-I protein
MPGSQQDTYLAEIKRQGVPVTIYLMNGFQLRGIVKGFDPFTIVLEYERKMHLIYKHAVSTISPQGPFSAPGNEAAPQAHPAEITSS